MAFVNERNGMGWKTVDHSRGVVLIGHGTNRENFSAFDLNWNGEIVNFGGYKSVTIKGNGESYILQWTIDTLKTPSNLQNERDEIIGMIEEALKVYGLYHNPNLIVNVDVEFKIKFS